MFNNCCTFFLARNMGSEDISNYQGHQRKLIVTFDKIKFFFFFFCGRLMAAEQGGGRGDEILRIMVQGFPRGKPVSKK